MNELLWVLAAFALLGLLLMLGVGKSGNNLTPSRFIGLDDLIEGGFFVVVVMIVLLPFYPLYLLGVVIWRWCHPPVKLPVEGDDSVWGRNVNRKRAEEAFRAVQEALTTRNPEGAREFMGPSLYADLTAECDRLIAQREINTRKDIKIDLIRVHDERLGDSQIDSASSITYFFDVTLRGTMINVTNDEGDVRFKAGSPLPQTFEEELQFSGGPKEAGRWWLVTLPGVPHAKKTGGRSGPPKRKRGPKKAEISS